MPSKKERLAQRMAQKRKQRLIQWLAIGISVVAVISIVVVLVISLNQAPIPTSGLTMGDPNAPIQVIEFADFQCPACAYFVQNIKPELIEKYISSGKVYFSFSPYSFLGQESLDAAEAGFCAADQNKFWAYYDYLFTHQGQFENAGAFSIANLNQYAGLVGLDTALFSECLRSGKYEQAVQDANQRARSSGLDSTPSFIVNGNVVKSQMDLIPAIETLLAEQ